MELVLQDTITFTPDLKWNKELPESEQVRVTVDLPTIEEYDKHAGPNGPKPELLKNRVKIENLSVNGKAITTGEELLMLKFSQKCRMIFAKIIYEILMCNDIPKDVEKN